METFYHEVDNRK